MRIALFSDGIYPYVIGGMQKHSFYLAKYLAREGVEVDLYHFNNSQKNIEELELFSEAERKNIHSIVLPFPRIDQLPGHYLRESFAYSCKVYEAYGKRPPVDYIYAKGFAAWKLLDEKRKGKIFPPVGVNFHGLEMFQPAPGFRARLEQMLLRSPVKFNLKAADQVFSYGGKITPLIESLGIPRAKIVELPTGIEEDWLVPVVKQAHEPRRFIFVGRFERRKGIEELNRVLQKLALKNIHFTFVGPIPAEVQLRSENYTYTGGVSDSARMQKLLREADVLVCPSHSEGMPNVILEGMASGLAILATDVGAVSAMVSNQNGWLIEPRNPEQLESAIVSAIEVSGEELNKMKQASLHKVQEQFLWEKLILQAIAKIKERITEK